MVALATIQRALDMLAEGRRIDVLQSIQAADHVVILPQGAAGFVFAGVGIELPYKDRLGCSLEREGDEEPQQIGPCLDDEAGVEFPHGFEQHLALLAWMLK